MQALQKGADTTDAERRALGATLQRERVEPTMATRMGVFAWGDSSDSKPFDYYIGSTHRALPYFKDDRRLDLLEILKQGKDAQGQVVRWAEYRIAYTDEVEGPDCAGFTVKLA